jgi:hypothetical protein
MTNHCREDLVTQYRRLAKAARLEAEVATEPNARMVYLRTAQLWEQKAEKEESISPSN